MQTQTQNMRVMLASEYPHVRHLLNELAKREPDAVVVGQAENGIKATALARSLKPDVAVLDFHLPHTVGLDTIPLSRVSGLDTALAISESSPNTRVIVVGNLDTRAIQEQGPGLAYEVCLSTQTAVASLPLMLREVSRRNGSQPGGVVFANVETNAAVIAGMQVKERKLLRQRIAENSDKAILLGGLAILGGLFAMITVILAPVGILLVAGGAGSMLLGAAAKMTSKLWPKASPARKKTKGDHDSQGR